MRHRSLLDKHLSLPDERPVGHGSNPGHKRSGSILVTFGWRAIQAAAATPCPATSKWIALRLPVIHTHTIPHAVLPEGYLQPLRFEPCRSGRMQPSHAG